VNIRLKFLSLCYNLKPKAMKSCPNSKQCPIFNGILRDRIITSRAYRSRYCDAGEEAFTSCMRFIVKQKYGKCPADLLPNPFMTIDQIAEKYKLA